MLRPLEMAHDFLREIITDQDTVVDATMGNGHDTLFLQKLAKEVYAFVFKNRPWSIRKSAWKKQDFPMPIFF